MIIAIKLLAKPFSNPTFTILQPHKYIQNLMFCILDSANVLPMDKLPNSHCFHLRDASSCRFIFADLFYVLAAKLLEMQTSIKYNEF